AISLQHAHFAVKRISNRQVQLAVVIEVSRGNTHFKRRGVGTCTGCKRTLCSECSSSAVDKDGELLTGGGYSYIRFSIAIEVGNRESSCLISKWNINCGLKSSIADPIEDAQYERRIIEVDGSQIDFAVAIQVGGDEVGVKMIHRNGQGWLESSIAVSKT